MRRENPWGTRPVDLAENGEVLLQEVTTADKPLYRDSGTGE